ncbi:MAG: molybdopterin molybdotransferase MoeA [Lachnospiraceae bacterium]|nr:molybdopterin molybdotransferase MoeA [Lachnospiraceae bacterium]
MGILTGISIEEGLRLITERIQCVDKEMEMAENACGRVLSENLISPENIPPFRRSPLDGYAFRAEDTLNASESEPAVFEIVEEIPAGKAPEHQIGFMQAAKILTGAPVPEGADAIEKFEVVEADERTLKLFHSYESGTNVVPVGEDIAKGDQVLSKGTVISPAYLGILAGLGYVQIPVYKKPLVYLISTGSELVSIDSPLELGKIRNSSIYTLKAFLEANGAQVKMIPIVRDDKEEIANAVRIASEEADLIFTTGGVSVGDYDMLQRSMEYLGAELLFWKMQMKPGGAFLASVYHGIPVLSLSGNPSAAAMALFMLGIPVLRKLAGRSDFMLETCQVKLLEEFGKKSFVRRFVPGRLVLQDGEAYISVTPSQGNGILHPLHGCNMIAELPKGSLAMKAGSRVKAYLLL